MARSTLFFQGNAFPNIFGIFIPSPPFLFGYWPLEPYSTDLLQPVNYKVIGLTLGHIETNTHTLHVEF